MSHGHHDGPSSVYGTSMVPGWVYQGGYTGWVLGGLYRGTTQLPARSPHDSEAGPGSPAGAGVGGHVGGVRTPAAGRLLGPPCGPGRCLRPLPVLGPSECRLPTNRARFDLNFSKVSQNGGVSPEKCEKASHSPYFQNGPQKSPLDFLGIPFSLAFSHKELMVPNMTYGRL